jgi:predicted XRE-type DNA-binding protein
VKTGSGWVRQHILVMEAFLGRKLEPWEVVHHINEDKKDNRIENLSVMSIGEHTALHHIGAKRSDEQKQNIRNAIRMSSRSKLSKEKVAWLKEQAHLGVMTQAEMAKTLNVSPMSVSRAVNNQTWN